MRNRSKLLARACLLFVLPPLLPAASVAGDPEFHSLVERVSAYYQKRPMRFMGLLDFVANRFTPHGVSHLKMAIFEDVDSSRMLPAEGFGSFMQGVVGPSYEPFVRVHNNHSGDLTFIYVRESGKKSFEMLIVSIDSTDAVLMKMQLNPGAMRDWVDEPVERGKGSGHRGESSAVN